MKTDTEIKNAGMISLMDNLGDVDAERFISLIQRERFNYTKWRSNLLEKETIESISSAAMGLRKDRKK